MLHGTPGCLATSGALPIPATTRPTPASPFPSNEGTTRPPRHDGLHPARLTDLYAVLTSRRRNEAPAAGLATADEIGAVDEHEGSGAVKGLTAPMRDTRMPRFPIRAAGAAGSRFV